MSTSMRFENESHRLIEEVARRRYDIDDIGTDIWQIVGGGDPNFVIGLEASVQLVKAAIDDMQRRGAVPTRLILRGDLKFLEIETRFGATPNAIRDAIVDEWLARGGSAEAGLAYHFGTPDMIATYNAEAELQADWRRTRAPELRRKAERGPA